MKQSPTNSLSPAIALVIVSTACFAALDTTTKFVSQAAPLMLVIWFRYLFQAVTTTAVLLPRRGRALLATRRPVLQFARGLALLSTSVLAFIALQHMPVGEFTAIVMLVPLTVTLMAAHALRERIGAARWALVGGGMVGALMIVRPGDALLGWAALLPLGVVATNTAYQILTSRLARSEDIGTMHFYTGWVGALAASLALPWFWQALPASVWITTAAIGLFSSVGHLLLAQGYRRAPAGALTPFLYFQIGFATLASWWVFDHTPDGPTWLGLVIIALCGALGTRMPTRPATA